MSVAEQRGVLRSRCEPLLEQIQAPVLKNEIRRSLNEHVYRRNRNDKFDQKPTETGKALMRSQSTTLSLGLYFAPQLGYGSTIWNAP